MTPTNEQIAKLFEDMGSLLEMKGDTVFKVRAYQRAARAIEQLSSPLAQSIDNREDLTKIPGIGKAISEKISEFIVTGQIAAYQKLLEELPAGVLQLKDIPGIGPKTAMAIGRELGISTVEEVAEAAADGRLASLPRTGQKVADGILRHIRALQALGQRTPIGQALPIAEEMIAALREQCPDIGFLFPAGSLRRWEDTIGDVDLIGTALDPELVADSMVKLPMVKDVLVHGPKKTSVIVESGIQIDLRIGQPESFGALLQYFTGSQQHNIRLRDYANRVGLSLNEYGVTDVESGEVETFSDEESFYARLGLPWIPPELRTGLHEVEFGLADRLPRLVEEFDLKGDLHLHTEWSDGNDPIELMLEAAVAQGYEYMAITDHSSGLGVANGLSNDRLESQIELLRNIQEEYEITVLCGSECDIRASGDMDYPDEILGQLDVVIASIHSAMGQNQATMTARMIKAMEHPSVTIIGHLTTRLLGQREPVDFDLEAVLQCARDTGTALEINASPERLDLRDTHAYRARELGVPLVINTDSHNYTHLNKRRFGVAVARRAWCRPEDIVNTMSRKDFLEYIRTPKPERTAIFDRRKNNVAPE
jgi:DNA polymerase (family 10)